MEDLKKENQMEENEKKDFGDTPTPSQDQNDEEQNFTDNSDLSPEDLENELNADDDDELDSGSLDEENPAPIKDDEQQPVQEKLLTQSQVNELVGKARKEGRESAMKDLMVRYGVDNENELDDMFGRGQAYDDLDYDYQNQGKSYKDAMAENALLKSHIDESRWEDVKAILSYKGLDINPENIAALLPTHPDWTNGNNTNIGVNSDMPQNRQILTEGMAEEMLDNQYQSAANQIGTKKPGMLKKLGNEPEPIKEKSEEEIAAEIYGYGKW